MTCIGASLSFVVLHRDCGRAPGRRACVVGQREYANAENTDYALFHLIFPLLLELYFLSLQVFEEQLVLSLDEDKDDGDIIDYSSSIFGEFFIPSVPTCCN